MTITASPARFLIFLTKVRGPSCSPTLPPRCNDVPDFIVERQLRLFQKVHPDYADGVPAALGLLVRYQR